MPSFTFLMNIFWEGFCPTKFFCHFIPCAYKLKSSSFFLHVHQQSNLSQPEWVNHSNQQIFHSVIYESLLRSKFYSVQQNLFPAKGAYIGLLSWTTLVQIHLVSILFAPNITFQKTKESFMLSHACKRMLILCSYHSSMQYVFRNCDLMTIQKYWDVEASQAKQHLRNNCFSILIHKLLHKHTLPKMIKYKYFIFSNNSEKLEFLLKYKFGSIWLIQIYLQAFLYKSIKISTSKKHTWSSHKFESFLRLFHYYILTH